MTTEFLSSTTPNMAEFDVDAIKSSNCSQTWKSQNYKIKKCAYLQRWYKVIKIPDVGWQYIVLRSARKYFVVILLLRLIWSENDILYGVSLSSLALQTLINVILWQSVKNPVISFRRFFWCFSAIVAYCKTCPLCVEVK